MVFNESYGTMPQSLLNLIRQANVSVSDWDAMLNRWGFTWGDTDLPFDAIANHIETHRVSGSYRYPMYG